MVNWYHDWARIPYHCWIVFLGIVGVLWKRENGSNAGRGANGVPKFVHFLLIRYSDVGEEAGLVWDFYEWLVNDFGTLIVGCWTLYFGTGIWQQKVIWGWALIPKKWWGRGYGTKISHTNLNQLNDKSLCSKLPCTRTHIYTNLT